MYEYIPPLPDSAAVFAAALSLYNACKKCESEKNAVNLSESYDGLDIFMRVIMRAAELFESWACTNIAFQELNDVWPYLLENKFGDTCLALISPDAIDKFDSDDCLRIALRLRLPVKFKDELRIPVDITVPNPIAGSSFVAYRIQTLRNHFEDNFVEPFTRDDEPFDEEFDVPFFGFYGVNSNEQLEHIADRKTYAEIVTLVNKIVPTLDFPDAESAISIQLQKRKYQTSSPRPSAAK